MNVCENCIHYRYLPYTPFICSELKNHITIENIFKTAEDIGVKEYTVNLDFKKILINNPRDFYCKAFQKK